MGWWLQDPRFITLLNICFSAEPQNNDTSNKFWIMPSELSAKEPMARSWSRVSVYLVILAGFGLTTVLFTLLGQDFQIKEQKVAVFNNHSKTSCDFCINESKTLATYVLQNSFHDKVQKHEIIPHEKVSHNSTTIEQLKASLDSRTVQIKPPNQEEQSTSETQVLNQSPPPNTKKYLIYFSHSGFANQIQGMLRAAHLAYLTHRVLVLPPLLPHKGNIRGYVARGFAGQTYGGRRRLKKTGRENTNGCMGLRPSIRKKQLQIMHREGELSSRQNTSDFSSFYDVIDFERITQITGQEFMDLPEFMDLLTKNKWSFSYGRNISLDLDGYCNRGVPGTNKEIADRFEKNFGSEPVAAIGSAFSHLRYLDRSNFTFEPPYSSHPIPFEELFVSYPPSPTLIPILKQMYALLPEHYTGVQIRLRDFNVDCNSPAVQTAFGNVFESLFSQNVSTNTPVLIASNYAAAAECFRQRSQSTDIDQRYGHVSTVESLISGQPQLQKMIKESRIADEIAYLLLDQIVIALADVLVFDTSAFVVKGSTFQLMIQSRHALIHRNELLALIDGSNVSSQVQPQ